MSKRKDTSHQRLLAAARRALAARHVVSPVPAFNARVAKLEAAGKRARRENQPTPEQEAKATYVEADVNDYVNGRRTRIGRAFQRQARFETIEGLSVSHIMALRRYRRAFDTSELSPVKSALDVGPGGGGSGAEAALSRLEAIAFADVGLRRIEEGLPRSLRATMRAVALYDQDFKAVALTRFGSATSRRRQRIRDEFLTGAEALSRQKVPVPKAAAGITVPLAELPPLPPVDPAFLDKAGRMRPMSEIASILRGGDGLETQDEQE